jgi:transglutaminase/protease-like cytokinesis protein 3
MRRQWSKAAAGGAASALIVCWFALWALPVAAVEDYRAIDQHALSAPKEVEGSVATLVDYLIRPARNDRERLRAIFRWVTANISYDTQGFFAGYLTDNPDSVDAAAAAPAGRLTPELVLSKRSSNCDGYSLLLESMVREAFRKASLLDTMAQQARLGDIVLVKGFAKGYGYRAGSGFEKRNHAWNAVNLDGQWYFIDCTWGAGYPNEKREFVREFEDYYFLARPAELIYTHFPDDPASQHLEKTVSKEEFIDLAFLWPAFFKYGMKPVSHTHAVIRTGASLEVSLSAPDTILLEADLLEGNRPLEQRCVFLQQDSGTCRVQAVFPRPGEYILRLFSRRAANDTLYKETLDYKVLADSGASGPVEFPQVYDAFRLRRAYLYEPLTRSLAAAQTHLFRLKVPGAKSVSVVTGEKWIKLEPSGEVFAGEVATVPGPVQVYARFEGLSADALLEYVCP